MKASTITPAAALPVRYAALGLGIFALLLGLAGFMPQLTSGPASAFPGPGYGYVFGLFPTNYFHNAIGVLVGLWGIAGFTSLGGAIGFNQAFAIIYGIQAIFGAIPYARTLFGIMPLYGNNIWLSLLLAGISYYYGFVKPGFLTRGTGFSVNS